HTPHPPPYPHSLHDALPILTSPTGAVIQDILRVVERRYANLEIAIYPARVQGPEAVGEIVRGIRAISAAGGFDVLIVARGGGSLDRKSTRLNSSHLGISYAV